MEITANLANASNFRGSLQLQLMRVGPVRWLGGAAGGQVATACSLLHAQSAAGSCGVKRILRCELREGVNLWQQEQ